MSWVRAVYLCQGRAGRFVSVSSGSIEKVEAQVTVIGVMGDMNNVHQYLENLAAITL